MFISCLNPECSYVEHTHENLYGATSCKLCGQTAIVFTDEYWMENKETIISSPYGPVGTGNSIEDSGDIGEIYE